MYTVFMTVRMRTYFFGAVVLAVVSVSCVVLPKFFTVNQPQVAQKIVLPPSERIIPKREYVAAIEAATNIPILMYHYIRTCTNPDDKDCPSLSVSADVFAEQLVWLQEHGYTTVDLDYFAKPYRVWGKPVVITFDDGYKDAYDAALPILEKYGMTATFYVITDRVGTPEYLTWNDVRDMYRRGMTIGSHTLDHRDMASLLPPELLKETLLSKQVIERYIGALVADFCYPYGRSSMLAQEAVQQAGYRTAVTTKEGIAKFTDPLLQLPRVRMKENTDLQKALEAEIAR